MVVWLCSRTQPLSAVGEDLAALGAGSVPFIEGPSEVGVEVRASSNIPGKRETSQSFAYFVLWDWLKEDSKLSEERVGLAFWNVPDKAPIVSSLLWHGSVYGGLVKKGIQLVLIEKIGDNARMTGPWEFGGNGPFRIGVDDQPLVAEMVKSRVAIYYGRKVPIGEVTKYTVREGDTLWRISRMFGATVSAIAQANNIVSPDLILAGQVLVIPANSPANN
ncbi:MAG: LysM peptidoglycan-binding domain-containing protein [Anaerolineae bacterium]